MLMDSILKYQDELHFDILAYIILPDQFHLIVDVGKSDISEIMQKIKLSFSKKLRTLNGRMDGIIWQRRFWDHVIRDQDDLNKHIDYIHYNPVKHGLAHSPFNWECSTIHDYYAGGYYSSDWGIIDKLNIDGEYGE